MVRLRLRLWSQNIKCWAQKYVILGYSYNVSCVSYWTFIFNHSLSFTVISSLHWAWYSIIEHHKPSTNKTLPSYPRIIKWLVNIPIFKSSSGVTICDVTNHVRSLASKKSNFIELTANVNFDQGLWEHSFRDRVEHIILHSFFPLPGNYFWQHRLELMVFFYVHCSVVLCCGFVEFSFFIVTALEDLFVLLLWAVEVSCVWGLCVTSTLCCINFSIIKNCKNEFTHNVTSKRMK